MPFDVQGALNAGYSPAQIADEVGRAAGFDTAAARKSGYSDDQIIKELAAPTHGGPADSSYLADLKAGANSAMETTGTALQGVGGILQRNGLPGGETISGAGEFLRNNAPSVPQNYHNRGGDIVQDLGQGNFSRALGDVGHFAAGAAVPTLAMMGAGALGAAAGAPAAIGAGALGGAMELGAGAGERAAAAGRAVPNTEDMKGAALRGAAGALLSGVGAGKLVARTGTPLTRAATMAGVGGAQAGVDQYDTTGKIDPAQMANAAIGGAALSGLTEVPGAVRGGAKTASDAVLSRVVGAPEGQEAQQSTVRVANAVKDQMATQPGLRLTDAANRVKLDLYQQAVRVLQQNKDAIDPQDFRELRSDISDGARRQNNTVGDDTFAQIDSLNIPADQKAALTEYTRDLNTASTQSFIKNTTGPLQKIGGALGQVAAIGGGLYTGNPLEMAAGVLGHSIAGRIGGGLGAMGDRFLGLNTPEVMLRAQAAQRALRAAGQDPNAVQATPMPEAPEMPPAAPAPAPSGGLSLIRQMQAKSAQSDVNPVTGNRPDPVPVNTPLPALRNDTAAAREDLGLPPSQEALQAAQMSAAAVPPGNGAVPPAGLQAPGRGHAYVAAGNPGVSAQAIHDAALHLESTGQLPAGTAAGLANGIMPAQAKLIQSQLGIRPNLGPNASAPQGDVPTINSPIRYQAAVRGYQAAVAAKAADLRAAGQPQAADALVDIAVNHHTKAGKQAARAALPPHIRMQIPDFVVNQGG